MPHLDSACSPIRTIAGALFLAGASGCVMAHPSPAVVGPPPMTLDARAVVFASPSGSTIHAWLMPGRPGGGAVLLLHGVHGNRKSMLDRARFLHAAGFTVLAPDLQAHGESPGRYITYGALESLDAAAAMTMLRAKAPGERVGVVGVSMGGAASLIGPTPLAADALVLESVYPTFRSAVANRMRVWLGPLGFLEGAVTPALLGLVGPQVGVDEHRMRPIEAIAAVSAPLFVIAGTADRYTPLTESRALFARAHAPKELWEVSGAGHVDLHAFARAEYERRVGDFLSRYLRRDAGSGAGGGPVDATTLPGSP